MGCFRDLLARELPEAVRPGLEQLADPPDARAAELGYPVARLEYPKQG